MIHTIRKLIITVTIIAIFTVGCSNPTYQAQNPSQPIPASTPTKQITETIVPGPRILPSNPKPALPAISPTQITESNNQIKSTSIKERSAPSKIEADPIHIPEFPVSVTDSSGKEITIISPPERIVAYDAAAVETLFAIGEGHRIIATHSWVSYPPESEDIVKVGDAFNMDIEAIVALEPDLVFIFSPTFKTELENAGLKVLYIETINDDFTKLFEYFLMWGSITGAFKESTKLAEDFNTRVTSINTKLSSYKSGPSVFQDVGGLWTPGSNTLIGNVFSLLKLDNIAADIDGYAQISPEVIIESNPQYIIASYGDTFSGDPTFDSITAVRNSNIIVPKEDYLSIAGPRFIKGVEFLAHQIYPGLFD
mgnify:FL=1